MRPKGMMRSLVQQWSGRRSMTRSEARILRTPAVTRFIYGVGDGIGAGGDHADGAVVMS